MLCHQATSVDKGTDSVRRTLLEPDTLFARRYRISCVLSRGPTGTVCEAQHAVTRRTVVLKVMRRMSPSTSMHNEWHARFRREAQAVGALDTPHVVRLFDADTDHETGAPYIVLERLQGEDLGDLLRRVVRLPARVALSILSQACRGVAQAHAAGILHRDIKPGNLYLAEDDAGNVVVKLLDFGLARAVAEADALVSRTELTEAGRALGTPSTMSPEQACEARDVDVRTDIWSLGAVLHVMLTGRFPFQQPGDSPAEMLMVLSTGADDPPPIQELAPWVAPDVAAIVHKALRRNRSERYASVGEMHDDILALLVAGGDRLRRSDLAPLSDSEARDVAPRMTDEHLAPHARGTHPPVALQREPKHRAAGRNRRRGWPVLGIVVACIMALMSWGAIAMRRAPAPSVQSEAVPPPPAAASSSLAAEPSPPALPCAPPSSAPAPPVRQKRWTRPKPHPKWTPPISTPGL